MGCCESSPAEDTGPATQTAPSGEKESTDQVKPPLRMIVIMFGPPGSGKGTRAPYISEAYSIPQLSTGDLLRAAVHSESELGRSVEGVMKSGGLVDDQIVVDLVKERIQCSDCNKGFILDGFPRTLEQARLLDAALYPEVVSAVIALDVRDEVLVERICGRWVHKESGRSYHVKFNPPKSLGDLSPTEDTMRDDVTGDPLTQRADDTEEALRSRLAAYYSMTVPLLEHYQSIVVKMDSNENKAAELIKQDVMQLLETEPLLKSKL